MRNPLDSDLWRTLRTVIEPAASRAAGGAGALAEAAALAVEAERDQPVGG